MGRDLSRKWLIENYEAMVDIVAERRKGKSLSFMPPYSPPDMPEDADEYPGLMLLAMEREAVGFYLSGHPLDGLESFIKDSATHQITEVPEGEWATLAGVITFLEVKTTRKGKQMAVLTLEDYSGVAEVVFFPGSYEKVAGGLKEDAIVFISGKKDEGKFIGNRLEVPRLKGVG